MTDHATLRRMCAAQADIPSADVLELLDELDAPARRSLAGRPVRLPRARPPRPRRGLHRDAHGHRAARLHLPAPRNAEVVTAADWTTARVVRGMNGWTMLGCDWANAEPERELERDRGPLTPILDADGRPVARTVGDLTARHIGKRVRLDEHYDAKLETIFAHEGGEVSLNFTHPEGFAFGCSRPLDTPCEVIG